MQGDSSHLCLHLHISHLSGPVGHLYVFFGKMSMFFTHFVFIYSFPIELYEFLLILDINPLSDIWFGNIFSHSIDCLFILFMISFAMQFFSLM